MISAAFFGENSTTSSASAALRPWQARHSGRPLKADMRALRVMAMTSIAETPYFFSTLAAELP